MNCLWPATTRSSCLHVRSIFQSFHKVDSLATRLAYQSVRPYSISLLPYRRRDSALQKSIVWGKSSHGQSDRLQNVARTFASDRVVRAFAQLPEDYSDETGLAFSAKPLTTEEAHKIFGNIVTASTANRMLKILHGRRVAGTLEDPSLPSRAPEYEASAMIVGLKWLRKNVPVDEVLNAGLRAEKELAEMEADIVSDAERLGIYRPNSGKEKKGSVYGKSGLDAIRQAKEKALDDKEAARKKRSQADEIRQNTGTLELRDPESNVVLRQPRGQNPKIQYYIERAQGPNTPPDMTKLQRLLPSGLVVLATVLGCYIFAEVYTPPRNASRLWSEIPPSAATIISIILINSAILVAWRIPPAFRFLNKYFITVPGYPRPLSLIGNIFSHQSLRHISLNMLILYFVGTRLHEDIGRGNFIALYLGCGAIASYCSLVPWVLQGNFITSTLGASGAVYGIISCYLWYHREQPVTPFGISLPETFPTISALMALIGIGGLEVYALLKPGRSRFAGMAVDHYAHLGGFGAGIAAAELFRTRSRRKREMDIERRKNMGIIDRIRERSL